MSEKYYSQNKHQFEFVFTPDPNLFLLETLCEDKTQYYYTLANELPWDKIELVYNKCLSNQKKGTSNKPARAVIGALLVKHLEVLSDERTIDFIKQNPYAQYLCGLTYYAKSPLFSPELFVSIRKRLNINAINTISKFIHELVRDKQYQQAVEKAELARAKAEATGTIEKVAFEEPKVENTLKIDATCHDVEMRYPVDINLLEDVSRHIDRCLVWACPGKTKPETKRNETRRAYLQYIKVNHHEKEERSTLIWLQINNIKHDYAILLEALGKVNFNDIRFMPKYLMNPLMAGRKVVEQQEYMITKGIHTCPDRICSIFQPHVRCILRGKAGRRYEYGPKTNISDCGGIVYVDRISWNAYNEGSDLPQQLENYKDRMGEYPDELFADKIYMTKKNLEHIDGIRQSGGKDIKCDCPRLGRKNVSEGPSEEEQHVASGKRNGVEGDFGTSKRRYDSNEIRAKLPETAESWICLCYLAQNAKKLSKYLA